MTALCLEANTGLSVHHTKDACEARTLLCDKFKPHQMRRIDRTPFDFAHLSASVPEGTFNILRYGGAVEIVPEPFDDFFMLEMPIAAGVDIESEGRPSVRSDQDAALFLPPHVRFASTWRDGCVQLMLKVRNAEVLRRWQFMTGDPEAQLPRIHPVIDLHSAEGWRVQQMMNLMRQEFELAVKTKTNRLAQTPLAAATIDAVLYYYRERQGNHRVGGSYQILPAQLRHCVRYIEENIAGDLSVARLLAQTDYSQRTLFNLFHQFLGMTPKGYVQQQRLRYSRSLLRAGGMSVAEAARRSGFTHMGRFSSLYRKHYGENPSHT